MAQIRSAILVVQKCAAFDADPKMLRFARAEKEIRATIVVRVAQNRNSTSDALERYPGKRRGKPVDFCEAPIGGVSRIREEMQDFAILMLPPYQQIGQPVAIRITDGRGALFSNIDRCKRVARAAGDVYRIPHPPP